MLFDDQGGYKNLARVLIKDMGPGYGILFFVIMVILSFPIELIMLVLWPFGKLLEAWSKEDN